MQVLIVDDELSVRSVLRRIVQDRLGCEAREASNGLEGLLAIARARPNLVLLDIGMPVMDGVAMLQAIRTSNNHADLQVIAMSGVADRTRVARVAELGVRDFLLKPFDFDMLIRRTTAALSASTATPEEEGPRGKRALNGKVFLLIDRDPNFRSFARSILEGRFTVIDTDDGAAGIQEVVERGSRTTVVCVGHGLELFSPEAIAKAVRAVPPARRPRVYLLADQAEPSREADPRLFDGVMTRTFVPDSFLQQIIDVDEEVATVPERLRSLLSVHLRGELLSAAQQVLGVMTNREVTPLNGVEAEFQTELVVGIQLREAAAGAALWLEIAGKQELLPNLAEAVLGPGERSPEAGRESLLEITNTLAGRLRHLIHLRGISLDLGTPTQGAVRRMEHARWDVVLPVVCSDVGQLLIRCRAGEDDGS